MTSPDEKDYAGTHEDNGESAGETDGMTLEQQRHDQLTTAPDATEADAAPRIEVSEHDGNIRIDIADGTPIRPGPGPGAPAPAENPDGDGG